MCCILKHEYLETCSLLLQEYNHSAPCHCSSALFLKLLRVLPSSVRLSLICLKRCGHRCIESTPPYHTSSGSIQNKMFPETYFKEQGAGLHSMLQINLSWAGQLHEIWKFLLYKCSNHFHLSKTQMHPIFKHKLMKIPRAVGRIDKLEITNTL